MQTDVTKFMKTKAVRTVSYTKSLGISLLNHIIHVHTNKAWNVSLFIYYTADVKLHGG